MAQNGINFKISVSRFVLVATASASSTIQGFESKKNNVSVPTEGTNR